jgi:hypothetical protein
MNGRQTRCLLSYGMPNRRFPPPWSIEERQESFIVKDANGHAPVTSPVEAVRAAIVAEQRTT